MRKLMCFSFSLFAVCISLPCSFSAPRQSSREWSQPQHGLRVALAPLNSTQVEILFSTTNTLVGPVKTDLYQAVPPRYSAKLIDEKGGEVEKTPAAIAAEQKLRPFKYSYSTRQSVRKISFYAPEPETGGILDLPVLFKIGSDGEYTLKLTVFLLRDTGNHVDLSPVEIVAPKVTLRLSTDKAKP